MRRSQCPNRIFEAALGGAEGAGLIDGKRALDSTPLYDAVATIDTVTLIRSAIRGLLKAADEDLECELRDTLTSCDEYDDCAPKPQIDWEDKTVREILIASRAKDARARLLVLDGRELDPVVTAVGQDPGQGLRRLKGPHSDRPRRRDHHRNQGHSGNGSDASVACGLIANLLGDTDDDPVDHEGGGSANDEVVDAVVLNDDASDTETGDTDTV